MEMVNNEILDERMYIFRNNHENGASIDEDPLEGLVDSLECKYYRLQETVFAQPLAIHTENSDPKIKEEEIIFIHNVTIQKRNGKRNRYHVDIDAENPVCPQPKCARKFATTTLLKAHVRNVHCADKKRFACESCDRSFHAKYLLQRHRVTHTAEKRECPICAKMLSARTNLKVHISSHKDIRPYTCDVCAKSFTRRFTLQRHLELKHSAGTVSHMSGDAFRQPMYGKR